MVFKISGVDITPYIAFSGIKWSRNDVEASNAGRMQNSDMLRDRVAIKYRWDITCRPLTADEQATILTLIEPEFVTVQFTDPTTNSTRTEQFYSNNIPSTFMIVDSKGVEWWTGLVFPLIQK